MQDFRSLRGCCLRKGNGRAASTKHRHRPFDLPNTIMIVDTLHSCRLSLAKPEYSVAMPCHHTLPGSLEFGRFKCQCGYWRVGGKPLRSVSKLTLSASCIVAGLFAYTVLKTSRRSTAYVDEVEYGEPDALSLKAIVYTCSDRDDCSRKTNLY
jgi:hypothetical protein